MRNLAIGLLALATALSVIGGIAAALLTASAWPRLETEPEDAYAASLFLITMIALGTASGRAVIRHVRPRSSRPLWWEILLAALALTAGVALIGLGLSPTELDRRLLQLVGATFLLSACMLLLKPRRPARAS